MDVTWPIFVIENKTYQSIGNAGVETVSSLAIKRYIIKQPTVLAIAQSWHCDICSNKISIQTNNNEDLIPDHFDELDEDIHAELKQNLKIKGLEMANLNVSGLFHKLSEVKPFLLEETKFDVLAVTETHLNEKIKDDELHINNYCIARHDRQNSDSYWGGHLYILGKNQMVL